MKKLFVIVFVGVLVALPFQVSAKAPTLKQIDKIQTCTQKTWKQWKKDKFCMKLLKQNYKPADKQGKLWNGKTWKKMPRFTGPTPAQA